MSRTLPPVPLVKRAKRWPLALGIGALAAAGSWLALRSDGNGQAAPVTTPVANVATSATLPSPSSSQVTIRVETIPAGATVILDGASRGASPVDLPLARDRERELVVTLDAHEPHTQALRPTRDTTLIVNLTPSPPPTPSSAPPPTPVRRPPIPAPSTTPEPDDNPLRDRVRGYLGD